MVRDGGETETPQRVRSNQGGDSVATSMESLPARATRPSRNKKSYSTLHTGPRPRSRNQTELSGITMEENRRVVALLKAADAMSNNDKVGKQTEGEAKKAWDSREHEFNVVLQDINDMIVQCSAAHGAPGSKNNSQAPKEEHAAKGNQKKAKQIALSHTFERSDETALSSPRVNELERKIQIFRSNPALLSELDERVEEDKRIQRELLLARYGDTQYVETNKQRLNAQKYRTDTIAQRLREQEERSKEVVRRKQQLYAERALSLREEMERRHPPRLPPGMAHQLRQKRLLEIRWQRLVALCSRFSYIYAKAEILSKKRTLHQKQMWAVAIITQCWCRMQMKRQMKLLGTLRRKLQGTVQAYFKRLRRRMTIRMASVLLDFTNDLKESNAIVVSVKNFRKYMVRVQMYWRERQRTYNARKALLYLQWCKFEKRVRNGGLPPPPSLTGRKGSTFALTAEAPGASRASTMTDRRASTMRSRPQTSPGPPKTKALVSSLPNPGSSNSGPATQRRMTTFIPLPKNVARLPNISPEAQGRAVTTRDQGYEELGTGAILRSSKFSVATSYEQAIPIRQLQTRHMEQAKSLHPNCVPRDIKMTIIAEKLEDWKKNLIMRTEEWQMERAPPPSEPKMPGPCVTVPKGALGSSPRSRPTSSSSPSGFLILPDVLLDALLEAQRRVRVLFWTGFG
ncbi:hypothetical protein CYMTET_18514 [Cymbomonas tetramitiformis]|uniref:Uncharacterized protein n=1 Tax=Cymbomonas tetramitiformis TaxID=36881 RepID=A0AAE0G7V8_9CHLO|nr:hypothetical protein CYMTET_18514 [Cymbomonas tetramitiformis]